MILSVKNLYKKYKRRVIVDEVSMSIKQGEIVGLLGPNGAGKSTVFHIIIGIITDYCGSVYIDGIDVNRWPMYKRARAGIGYLSQESSIFNKLTVEDNLKSIAQMIIDSKLQRKHKVEVLLEDFNLSKLRKQLGVTLSCGEKRRLEIARALIINPKVLLLDEPFAAIDPIAVSDVQKIIKKLKSKGFGILITDHNVREIFEIVDRAYIIHDGKILFEGNVDNLLKNKEIKSIYLGDNFKI
ncbi:MAG: LPS export ABC transporter ATP-binding protein [Endomicrobium sp.]|jgi:lipopolysaccharide export system ATP-binding protein|nr:LPS export ABC transporter ATP-binding protein [Endomicrobium sp.]